MEPHEKQKQEQKLLYKKETVNSVKNLQNRRCHTSDRGLIPIIQKELAKLYENSNNQYIKDFLKRN